MVRIFLKPLLITTAHWIQHSITSIQCHHAVYYIRGGGAPHGCIFKWNYLTENSKTWLPMPQEKVRTPIGTLPTKVYTINLSTAHLLIVYHRKPSSSKSSTSRSSNKTNNSYSSSATASSSSSTSTATTTTTTTTFSNTRVSQNEALAGVGSWTDDYKDLVRLEKLSVEKE